jgi:hypothetical protein
VLVVSTTWAGQFEDAIRTGEEYLSRFGDDPEIHHWVAVAHWRLGHVAIAERHFDHALTGFVGSNAYSSAGLFFKENGKLMRAREVWSQGLQFAELRLAGASDNIRLRTARLEMQLALGHKTEALGELAQIESLFSEGRWAGDCTGLWIKDAFSLPEIRVHVVRIIKDNLSGNSNFWAWVEVSRILGFAKTEDAPELVPLERASRAQEDSLRRRFALPPRPGV